MQSRRQNTPSIPVSSRRPISIARSREKNYSSQKNLELGTGQPKVLESAKGDSKKSETQKLIFNELIPSERIAVNKLRRNSGSQDSRIRKGGIQVTQLADRSLTKPTMLGNEMRMRLTERGSIDSSCFQETGSRWKNSIQIEPESKQCQKKFSTPIDTLDRFRQSLDKRQYQRREEPLYDRPEHSTVKRFTKTSQAKQQFGINQPRTVQNVFVLSPEPFEAGSQKVILKSFGNNVYSPNKLIAFHSPQAMQQQRVATSREEMQRSLERIRKSSGSNTLIGAVHVPPKPMQRVPIRQQYQDQPSNLRQTQRPGTQNILFVHPEPQRTIKIYGKSPTHLINSNEPYSPVGNKDQLTRRNRVGSVQTNQNLNHTSQTIQRQPVQPFQQPVQSSQQSVQPFQQSIQSSQQSVQPFQQSIQSSQQSVQPLRQSIQHLRELIQQSSQQPVYQQSPSQNKLPRHVTESPWRPAQSNALIEQQLLQVSQPTVWSQVYSQEKIKGIDIKTTVPSNQSKLISACQQNTIKTTDTVMGISTLLTQRQIMTQVGSSLSSSISANKITNQSTPLKMTTPSQYKQSVYQNESLTREGIRNTESRVTETDKTRIRLTTNYRKDNLQENSHKSSFQGQKKDEREGFWELMNSAKIKAGLGQNMRDKLIQKYPISSSISSPTQVSTQSKPNISQINSQTPVKQGNLANKFRAGEEYLEKSSQDGYYGNLPARRQDNFRNEYNHESQKEYLMGDLSTESQVKASSLGKKSQTVPVSQYKAKHEWRVQEEYGYVPPAMKNSKPDRLIDGSIIGNLQMLIDEGGFIQPPSAEKFISDDYTRQKYPLKERDDQESQYKGSQNFKQSKVYNIFSSEYENNKAAKLPVRYQQSSRQYNNRRSSNESDTKQFYTRDSPAFDLKASEEIVEDLRRLRSSNQEDSYLMNERFKLNSKKVIDDIFDKETNRIMRSMKSIEDRNRSRNQY